MKKTIVYALVILGCIAIGYLISYIGIQFEGKRNVSPWGVSIGVLAVAAVMAAVRKVAERKDKDTPSDPQE